MKTSHLLTAALCLLISTATVAQQDTAAAQKAWMAYMTPGVPHQKLAASVGDWTTNMTYWEGPGSVPKKATGTCTFKMLLGDRFQESHFRGDFMGMPFEGIGTTAYDNNRQVFINSWIDNMGTGMMILEGKWDGTVKGIVLKGKMIDPISGKEISIKEIIKWQDPNHHTLEMFREVDGKEFKEMEIAFSRP